MFSLRSVHAFLRALVRALPPVVGPALVLPALVLPVVVLVATSASASPASSVDDELSSERVSEAVVGRLQQYLRIDTTNPPGNEQRGVEFFAAIFEREGIAYDTAESAPGRGNIWARLEGGDEPGLLLLHHIDVVPADDRYWDEAPLSGAIRDGYLYGRGALDTKGLGILHLEAFLELHRSGRELDRDVVFMATADEEAGGFYGVGWLVEHRADVFEDIGLVLNEGGGGMLMGDRPVFSIEVTQKVPLWLRLVARGAPGHGSTPRSDSSVRKLVRALARVEAHDFPARVVPAVERYFGGLAKIDPRWADAFTDLDTTVADAETLDRLQRENPQLHALLRNTCSLTRLEGSSKINVVPPEAAAELDCRLLPDEDPKAFLADLRRLIAEPDVEIETLMGFSPAISTTDTDLYRAIEAVALAHHPEALVLPSVVGGFTDSHFLRDLGMVAYGFRPGLLPVSEAAGVHGNNERIQIEDLRLGARMMLEIVDRLTR